MSAQHYDRESYQKETAAQTPTAAPVPRIKNTAPGPFAAGSPEVAQQPATLADLDAALVQCRQLRDEQRLTERGLLDLETIEASFQQDRDRVADPATLCAFVSPAPGDMSRYLKYLQNRTRQQVARLATLERSK